MGIQISNSTYTAYQSGIHPTVHAQRSTTTAQSGTTQPAVVYGVDPASAAKSLSEPDAPLSDAELKQLFSVFKTIGDKDELWTEIGSLLTELSGDDRTNFLSVISRSGDSLAGVVSQLSRLGTDDRSVYLRTAVRLDPEEGLKNLVRSVGKIKGETLTAYLKMADSLGRSFDSLESDELKNFIKAAAGSPEAIAALTQKTSKLGQENRPLFLKAAATAGDDLNRLISTADKLAGKDLTQFLSAAAKSGDGLSNLLDLTQKMDTAKRDGMFSFISALSEKESQNFLLASQGLEETAGTLMDASQGMSAMERDYFLTLSVRADSRLGRLVDMVNNLSPSPKERTNFLATAVKADGRFSEVLALAESLDSESRGRVFSFASELEFTDLSSFITAAGGNPGQAGSLAKAAGTLQGANKSYLLYAAAIHPGEASRLTELSGELEGEDLENFLFTAANTDDENGMADLLSETSRLSGSDRSEFLSGQRKRLTETGNAMAQEFVYLKSAFSEGLFTSLIASGPDVIDRVLSDLDAMDGTHRNTFFSLAKAAGKDEISTLLGVMSQLDEGQAEALEDVARKLDKDGQRDLIQAADLALSGPKASPDLYDRLLSTAETLSSAAASHFLHAAAVSGNTLETLTALTNDLGGTNKINFLIGAAGAADEDDDGRLLQTHVMVTDYIFSDILGNILELNDGKEGIRPSQIINTGNGQFNTNNKKDTATPSFYLESAAFLTRQSDASYDLHMDWYNSFMGIPA